MNILQSEDLSWSRPLAGALLIDEILITYHYMDITFLGGMERCIFIDLNDVPNSRKLIKTYIIIQEIFIPFTAPIYPIVPGRLVSSKRGSAISRQQKVYHFWQKSLHTENSWVRQRVGFPHRFFLLSTYSS